MDWLVAPYVGAWIETFFVCSKVFQESVAPYVGAWIETTVAQEEPENQPGRSLRGSVD